jgi:hypothetical protein
MTWAPGKDIAFLIAGGDLYPEVLYAIGPDGTDQRLLSGSRSGSRTRVEMDYGK